MLEKQAKVSLVGSRGRLRQSSGVDNGSNAVDGNVSDQFNDTQADRIVDNLDQSDDKNLDLISRMMINSQRKASDNRVQLRIELPLRGRMITFTRPLLVEPDSPLELSFDVESSTPIVASSTFSGISYVVVLFLAATVVLYFGQLLLNKLNRFKDALNRPKPEQPEQPEQQEQPEVAVTMAQPADNEPVSAEELENNITEEEL